MPRHLTVLLSCLMVCLNEVAIAPPTLATSPPHNISPRLSIPRNSDPQSPTLLDSQKSSNPFTARQELPSSTQPTSLPTLKVGINEIKPFVFLDPDTPPYGFSIDLWNAVAEDINHTTEFVIFKDVSSLLDAVRAGTVDAGISGISITLEREAAGLNFSYPIYESGLQLLVLEAKTPFFVHLVNQFGGQSVILVIVRVLGLSIVAGALFWWFEHKHNAAFPNHPIPGIGQGIWFAIVTLGTFGYGDVTPTKLPGRMLACVWMGFSFFIVGDFISAMTTARQSAVSYQGLSDLRGQPIGVRKGTTGEEYMKSRPFNSLKFTSFEAQLKALEQSEVAGIVLDYPTAQYFALHNPAFVLAGERLVREDYGIVFSEKQIDLQERVNQALLRLSHEEVLKRLDQKWFHNET